MGNSAGAKVGVVVVLGAVLMGAGWSFLSHLNLNTYTVNVVFADTKGLLAQAPVRMNGVKIGEVGSIRLRAGDNMPVVALNVENGIKVPKDSEVAVSSGILVTNPEVSITPGKADVSLRAGDTITGAPAKSALAQLSPELASAVTGASAAVNQMAPQVSQLMKRLDGILIRTDSVMRNAEAVSGEAKSLSTDPRLRKTLRSVLDDMAAISSQGRSASKSITADLSKMVKQGGGRVDQLTQGMLELLQRLTDTVDAARGLVTRLAEQVSDPRLQSSLSETLDLARSTLARFNQVASDVHQLVGDTGVQSDLKATLSSARAISEQGRKLSEDISKVVERLNLPGGAPRLGLGQPTFTMDFAGRSLAPHFRSDLTMTTPLGKASALKLGVHNFAETNNLVAQYQTRVGAAGDFRYGLYASKLGVGWEFTVAPGTKIVLDGYDPNRFRLDTRALIDISPDFALLVGTEGIFRQISPVVGFRLKR